MFTMKLLLLIQVVILAIAPFAAAVVVDLDENSMPQCAVSIPRVLCSAITNHVVDSVFRVGASKSDGMLYYGLCMPLQRNGF